MAQTVKAFVEDSYQLVSASSPTVPLQGNDMSKGVQFMNELLQSYSANGLLITVAREVVYTMSIGQQTVTFGASNYVPTPDVTIGRLANLQNAWLLLDGVTYPLNDESRNEFFASYKYQPQQGLPRYVIVMNQVELTTLQVYPAPSQPFQLHVYGKFQLPIFLESGDMSALPLYYSRYLKFALAKDLAMYKGRSEAWTDKLEGMLVAAENSMQAVSSVNLEVETDHGSWLNGSWRAKAGI